MIAYLKGKILSTVGQTVTIVTGGVGYEVCCSSGAMYALAGKDEGELYTYMAVREDGVFLYGFSSVEEKNMFLKLITVSGVGPKMGITVLSGLSLNDLALAIASSDVKTLASVKGLGKKTAERIIVELRENISSLDLPTEITGKKVEKTAPLTKEDEDAIIALMSLGYSRQESIKKVDFAKSQGATTLEEIITQSLRG